MPDKSKNNRTSSVSKDKEDATQERTDAPEESGEGDAIDHALSLMADTIAADRAFARDARVAISAVEDSPDEESDEVVPTKSDE